MKHLWIIKYSSDIEGYIMEESFLVYATHTSEAENIARHYIECLLSPAEEFDDDLPIQYSIETIEMFDDSKHGLIHTYQII